MVNDKNTELNFLALAGEGRIVNTNGELFYIVAADPDLVYSHLEKHRPFIDPIIKDAAVGVELIVRTFIRKHSWKLCNHLEYLNDKLMPDTVQEEQATDAFHECLLEAHNHIELFNRDLSTIVKYSPNTDILHVSENEIRIKVSLRDGEVH